MDTKNRPLVTMQPTPELTQSELLHSQEAHLPVVAKPVRESALRQQRMNKLMESCQEEILRQIIGPFGLTPAMFDDKTGGNVTTTHNFERGTVATEEDRNRYEQWQVDYDRQKYDEDKKEKREARLKDHDTEIISAYTGNKLPRDGRMHLDHVVPVKTIEDSSRTNLFMTHEQRISMANAPENLVPAEQSINCSMGDRDKLAWAESQRKKDPGKTNSESFGIDQNLLQQTHETGQKHIEQTVLSHQMIKQGSELAIASAQETGKNALRQAFGILLHEFVNGSFTEVKLIVRERNQDNLIDRIVESIKRVMNRVVVKLKSALDAAIQGGIQGLVSNLLTFLINNFITTAKKVVTLIRESMKSLWDAIKMMVNPPEGMPAMEVTRQVTKIISAAITAALGMMLEESVKGFLTTSPLAPLAGILSPALTAIITGIASALVIYGVDRIFDWLSATGTEMLQAMENSLHATGENIERMGAWLELQFQNSQHHAAMVKGYALIGENLDEAYSSQSKTLHMQHETIHGNDIFLEQLSITMTRQLEEERDIINFLEGNNNQ